MAENTDVTRFDRLLRGLVRADSGLDIAVCLTSSVTGLSMVAMDTGLRSVVELASRISVHEQLPLALTEPERSPISDSDSRDVDQRLREAASKGLVDAADRYEGDGQVATWIGRRATVTGLREIGHWPPQGAEMRPGPWDEHEWGQTDRPLLQSLADEPPRHGYLGHRLGGDSEDATRWRAVQRLLAGGLIDGRIDNEGVDGLLITSEGRRALGGPDDDPLDSAAADLARGARADAMTAVETVLRTRMRELADLTGVAWRREDGRSLGLGDLNDRLAAAGAYDKSWRAEIAWVLSIRNETNHDTDTAVSDTRIERAIAAVREMRDTLIAR